MTLAELVAAARSLAPDAAVERRPAPAAPTPRDGRRLRLPRRVAPGTVFVALRGQHADGAAFAAQAIARGAVADRRRDAAPRPAPACRGFARPDARLALAVLAADLLRPSERASCTRRRHHRHQRQDDDGVPAGVDLRRRRHAVRPHRHGRLPHRRRRSRRARRVAHDARGAGRAAAAARDGRRAAAAPARWRCRRTRWSLQRVDGMRFAAGVFTNLTRDHLDFHGDMEAYFAAKRRLFEMLPAGAPGVINVDDPRGAALAATLPRGRDLRASTRPPTSRRRRCHSRSTGSRSRSARRAARCTIRSPLVGRPNVYNILGGVATAHRRSTCRSTRSKRASRALDGVPAASRSSRRRPTTSRVVVDYAHTDDALKNLLETARPLAPGRLDHGVRLRRRSRSHEAAADGRGRGAAERPRRRSRRTTRGPRIPSGSSRRSSAASCRRSIPARRSAPATPFVVIVDRRAAIEQAIRDGASRATSCSSPARATRSTRSSATGRCRSTTSRSRARRWRGGARRRRRVTAA